MKEEIIKKIMAVINTLNAVTVCGKYNLSNLSGSIAVLEDVCNDIAVAKEIQTEESTECKTEKH